MMRRSFKCVAFMLFLVGCTGEEVARLPINTVSTDEDVVMKETTINLKKGDEIGVWSDMDIEYEGEVDLRFRLEILKNGLKYDGMEIDPTDKSITIGEIRTSFNDEVDWSFTGKNTEITITEDATYTFKAILVASENPSLKVTKGELVFKK